MPEELAADNGPGELLPWPRVLVIQEKPDGVFLDRYTEDGRPGLPNRLPRAVLSISEAKRVLAQPDLATALGLRDRAILEVLYSTGLRRMELVGLDLADLDAERGVVLVREAKGK